MTQPVLKEATTTPGIPLETFIRSGKRMEVIGGILQEKPMTGFEHTWIVRNIFRILDRYVSENKLGEVFGDNLTCNLSVDKAQNVRVARLADASFIRADAIPDFDHKYPFPGAPTLAIEVLSPAESVADVMAKVSDYLRYGSEQVWVLYPKKQQLVQYINGDESVPQVYKSNDTLTDDRLFPGLELAIRDLFNQ